MLKPIEEPAIVFIRQTSAASQCAANDSSAQSDNLAAVMKNQTIILAEQVISEPPLHQDGGEALKFCEQMEPV